jgi:hypothetical protein
MDGATGAANSLVSMRNVSAGAWSAGSARARAMTQKQFLFFIAQVDLMLFSHGWQTDYSCMIGMGKLYRTARQPQSPVFLQHGRLQQ